MGLRRVSDPALQRHPVDSRRSPLNRMHRSLLRKTRSLRRAGSGLRCISNACSERVLRQVANAVLFRASGATPASCDRSWEAVCLLFERRVSLHGSLPGVWLAVGSVRVGLMRPRACRSLRNTPALYAAGLFAQKAFQIIVSGLRWMTSGRCRLPSAGGR